MTDTSITETHAGVRIRRLPANRRGRDLIVGDLHGCRVPFDRALEALAFDPAVDRVLSVGDLVDRGPDSPGCLRLLREPWFHAVTGNHEAMMVEHVAGQGRGEAAALHMMNGGDWVVAAAPWRETTGLAADIERAADLPHLLVVEGGGERFHLIHAELAPPGRFDELPGDGDIDAGLPGVGPDRLVWSRSLMGPGAPPVAETFPGLSPTYCGHTPMPTLRRRLSHICLDTGAVFGWQAGGAGGLDLAVAERRDGVEVEIHRFPA